MNYESGLFPEFGDGPPTNNQPRTNQELFLTLIVVSLIAPQKTRFKTFEYVILD